MRYRIPFMLSLLMIALLWAGCSKDDNNDNNTPNEPALIISLPVANVGDQVSFTVTNYQGYPTGYRFDPGDGSGPVSHSYSSYTHTYNSPGTYTVTATVFENNQSTTLTASITVESNGSTSGPAIRIRKIELLSLEHPYKDNDVFLNMEPDAYSDPYFNVTIVNDDANSTQELIYPRSSTKQNTQTTTWNFTNEIPLIYYENDIRRVELDFMDDDTNEGSSDDFAGSIVIYNSSFAPYITSKPSEIQWTYMGTAINMTVDWID